MYHVKNDKRSLTSAEYIYQALAFLLKNHDYETISVSKLCEQANVSRATFYRNFDIIEDVLAWRGEKLITNIFYEYFSNPILQETVYFNRFAMACGLKESDYIEALSRANKSYVLQDRLFYLLDNVPLNVDTSIPNPYLKYALAAKIGAFFGTIHCWIVTGKKESLNDLLNNLDEVDRIARNLSIDTRYISKTSTSHK